MSSQTFRIVPLAAAHDRAAFHSGSGPLDRYFQELAAQDIRRRVASCFVALATDGQVAGFYTLASASLPLNLLPIELAKRLPRYPTVPTVRMGRLAVDRSFKGQGLGGALLADALDRAVRSDIAAYAMMVDAKDDTAVAFYRHHGFIALPDHPVTLFVPLVTIKSIIFQ